MPPRTRSENNRDLPPNLYPRADGHGFDYKDPVTKRKTYLSAKKYARAEAIIYARQRNESLAPKSHQKIGSVAWVIRGFLEYLEETGKLKPSTLARKKTQLGVYEQKMGGYRFVDVTRRVLSAYWKTIGANAWTQHRTAWSEMYVWAIAQGYAEINEAKKALGPTDNKLERKTQRHTEKGVALMLGHDSAPDWLRLYADIALASLQDRSTICNAKRSDVTWREDGSGTWRCIRSKTETALEIELEPGTRLHAAVRKAYNTPIAGTYLLRRVPARKIRKGKSELSQVLPGLVTSTFRAVRTASGAYADLDSDVRPGVHQLRALGAYLYELAGFSPEYIQQLMGHKELKMTEHYLAEHEGREVEFAKVRAGL